MPIVGEEQQSGFLAQAQVRMLHNHIPDGKGTISKLVKQTICTPAIEPVCTPASQLSYGCSQSHLLQYCREAVFNAVIDEVMHPSQNMPFKHLAVEELADHLFQLGKHKLAGVQS